MRTIEYLSNPGLASYFWPVVLTTLVIALLGGAMSWLVVVKRLSFIGQGVSHSAFGGVGIALVLGLGGSTLASESAMMLIVVTFSLLSAAGMAVLSGRLSARSDTAIGIVLSLAMALGFLLYSLAESQSAQADRPPPPSLESILFGSVTLIDLFDLVVSLVVACVVLSILRVRRHHIVFWMFDESAAPAFGVDTTRVRMLVMAMLALVVVITMKLAGVVLATAMLVLPGALALQLSCRLTRVLILSITSAVVASLAGLGIAFEMDIQPGPTIVLVLGLFYLFAWGGNLMRTRRIRSAEPGATT